MSSKLGEKLDHYGDLIQLIIGIYILFDTRHNKNIWYFIIPFIIFLILNINIGCQQRWINKSNRKINNESIKYLHNACPNKLYKNPGILKIFGYGFSSIGMTIFIWNITSPIFNKK